MRRGAWTGRKEVMLTIRAEQLQILVAPLLTDFKERLTSHLIRFFPTDCQALEDRGLSNAVDRGLTRARSHGFRTENHVTKYLSLMFTFGRDFDTNPDHAWAHEILSLGCLNSEKMIRLLDRAFAEGDHGRGFLAEQGLSPIEPTLALRQRRFAEDRRRQWIELMSELVSYSCRGSRYLRWDDRVDLTGVEHLESIAEVVRRTPDIRHWLPTRAHETVRTFLASREEGFPPNLLVRIGATAQNVPAPQVAALTTSTIERSAPPSERRCPAEGPNGKCGECRMCWSSATRNVSFHPQRWESTRERAAA